LYIFPSQVHGFCFFFAFFRALPKRNFIPNSFSCIALELFQEALINNSDFSDKTVNNVIIALGFNPDYARNEELKELSSIFQDCSEHGADSGFSGFIYYNDTIAFYMANRKDIIKHMENTAKDDDARDFFEKKMEILVSKEPKDKKIELLENLVSQYFQK